MKLNVGFERDRHNATMVGIFFIIATVLYLIGGAVYGPVTGDSDYLQNAYPDRGLLTLGVFLEFVCVLAIPLIAMYAYPILKRVSEPLAVAYVGFRTLEVVFLIAIEAKLLSLVDLSEDYLAAEESEGAQFQAAGDAIQADIDASFVLYLMIFNFAAMIFYSMLFRSRLVPRGLSIWGFLSAAWMVIGVVIGTIFDTFTGSMWEVVLAAPLAINELVLAGWLILKGFNTSRVTPNSTAGKGLREGERSSV